MKMIAAVGRNYEIGVNNALPWHSPTDLKLFKQLTKDSNVVMGYRTMESLKRPLSERYNLVLINYHGFIPNGFYHASLEDVVSLKDEPVWVIGGAKTYSLLMPFVTEIWLSHMSVDVTNADTFFPAESMRSLGFKPVEAVYTQHEIKGEPCFTQIVYRR
ncbi:dihydrofolate reductase (plasmid) [Escherichia coli]|nr:dihydrofolate reductase [Escherichia coli]MBA8354057.1 dihydrofolate reductase [Escherichia coli]